MRYLLDLTPADHTKRVVSELHNRSCDNKLDDGTDPAVLSKT